MKIFAIIHNYGTPEGSSPMGEGDMTWYSMPDSSILRSGNPFFIPNTGSGYEAFPSLCLRIGRLGKSVAKRFASRYIDGWTMAAAVVNTYRLTALRKESMPWAEAVTFDRSCLLGNLQPIDTLKLYDSFEIEHNRIVSNYKTDLLNCKADIIVSAISTDNTIKTGDLILVGLTGQGIRLVEDSKLEIRAKELNLLDIKIK